MRTITTTLILSIIAMPLQAGDWRKTCGSVGELATTIMESRQSGVSMAKMMGAVSGEENSLAEKLIISAYDSPRYSTERMQKRTVEEFRDEVYLECVKAMRSQEK